MKSLLKKSALYLGWEATLNDRLVIIWLVGMVFGTPFSLEYIDISEFIKTPMHKKIIRGILGVCFSLLLNFVFHKISNLYSDSLSQFIFGEFFPKMISSFFLYGPFLIICDKIHLIGGEGYHAAKKEKEKKQKEPKYATATTVYDDINLLEAFDLVEQDEKER